MSLIVAVNLSDRIYIASDSRLSFFGDKPPIDLVLKIVPMSPNLLVGAVGNRDFASAVIGVLRRHFNSLEPIDLNSFFSYLKTNDKDIIGRALEKSSMPYDKAQAALVFAGHGDSKQKNLEIKDLIKKVGQLQDVKRQRIERFVGKRDIGDLPPNDLNHLVYLMEDRATMKEEVFSALINKNKKPGTELSVDVPEQTLFSWSFSATGASSFKVANYLEPLVFGAGFSEDILPQHFSSNLEFSSYAGDAPKDSLRFVESIYGKFGGSIGGGVAVFAILRDQVLFCPTTLERGARRRLIYKTLVKNEKINIQLPKLGGIPLYMLPFDDQQFNSGHSCL